MANQNNNTKKVEDANEQKQEQNPVNQPEKQTEEPKKGKVVKILGYEIEAKKAPKKDKASKPEKQPNGKWGLGKAVAVATVGVTAVGAAVKVATVVCDTITRRGACGGNDQHYEIPAYEREAIEGNYQDVPAANADSSVSEANTNE